MTTGIPPAAAPAPSERAPGGEGAPGGGRSEAPESVRGFSGRDRYLDMLRALALFRVVVYHIFGWAWLTVVFPAMGVMFALAGSLMARSLQRPAPGVVRRRVRRLLLPMWLYGVVVLTVLFLQGWQAPKGEAVWWWLRLACWVVPVGTPPFPYDIGSETGLLGASWAEQAAGPLWYLRAYFWFVLLSPLLLKAFRRLPWVTLLAPLGLTAVVGTGVVTIPGDAGHVVTDFAVYGSCWLLGFAHYHGVLRSIPTYIVPSFAPLFMGLGLWWASAHAGPEGWALDEMPLAQALWSFGYCALLMMVSPAWPRLPERLERYDRPITLANNRAVTLYLWHEAALLASVPLLDLLWRIDAMEQHAPWLLDSKILMFLLVWPLIALLVLAFGWAEDLAAGRRPRLWPTGPDHRAGQRLTRRLTPGPRAG